MRLLCAGAGFGLALGYQNWRIDEIPSTRTPASIWQAQDAAAAAGYVSTQPDTPFGNYVRESWARTAAETAK